MPPRVQTLHGDCRDVLCQVPDGSVHCCVTSPPYWGLRSYLPKDHPDKAREIGQEKTPEQFVATMVEVFREVRRCLHDSGTLWLNLGDSYSSGGRTTQVVQTVRGPTVRDQSGDAASGKQEYLNGTAMRPPVFAGSKPKDLCGIPWRVVLALQADGWYWRSCIVWHKKSCMPESVTDRPTNSWEPIFLLAKSQRYFYDAEAVKEPADTAGDVGGFSGCQAIGAGVKPSGNQIPEKGAAYVRPSFRNQRNVWSLGPEPYSEAHFATFPTEIPRRAILAGTSARGCCPKCLTPWERVVEKSSTYNGKRDTGETYTAKAYSSPQSEPRGSKKNLGGDAEPSRTVGWQPGCECNAGEPIHCTVLDPFGGSGTTGAVALELGRNATLCELNGGYLPLIQKRTHVTLGLVLA